MSGKGLQELGLKDEAMPEQSYDDLPEFGTRKDPPQPGPYRFRTAADLSKAFDVIDHAEKGQRIKVLFDNDAPLTIVKSPGNTANNETFTTQLSNVERKRGTDGPEGSDMDYLLKAFGEKSKPKSNQEYVQRVLAVGQNKEFNADIRFTWFCNDKKHIWVYEGAGEAAKLVEVETQDGCGRRYYQDTQTKKDEQKIKKQADGSYPLQVQCVCGGVVRAFANLDNIRA